MLHRNKPTLALAAMLTLATGCDQPLATAPAEALAASLDFTVPAVSSDDLSARSYRVLAEDPRADEPAAVTITDEPIRPLQQIFDPSSRVGYDPGYAWALGIHYYIGNVGAIETTAQVAHNAAHLGSFTAEKQDYTPFLLDFGQVKHIWVQAKVFTDHTCGLSVSGSSKHRAWWQFFQGRSSSEWGVALRTSQAAPLPQPTCATGQTGQTEVSSEGPTGITCYYLITYDLGTGEILNAEFLYCTGSGGVLM